MRPNPMKRYRLYIDESGDHTYEEICHCIEPKYNRRYRNGLVKGYGQVFLE